MQVVGVGLAMPATTVSIYVVSTRAGATPFWLDQDRMGAMSAALLSLGARVARELDRGTLEQVLVKGDNGYVLMLQAGNDAVLTVLASSQAKWGLIFLDAKRAAAAMAQAL